MKNSLFALLLFSIFLTSCGEAFSSGDIRSIANTQPAQVLPTTTSAPIPTATIGWEQTAIVAQQTADAASRIMAQETAAESSREHEKLSWTATVDAATFDASHLTQLSDAATATAVPTWLPITLTAAVEQYNYQLTEQADMRTQVAATLSAPTLIVQMAQSEAMAKYADSNAMALVMVKFAIAVFILCLSVVLIGFVFFDLKKRDLENPEKKEESPEPEPIPFVEILSSAGNQYLRAEINCSNEQLLELAEGVLERRMPLAFNAWEGTIVHRNLKQIREFMVDHKYAKVIRGSNGALDLQAEGERFLRECLQLGNPPPPYRCMFQN